MFTIPIYITVLKRVATQFVHDGIALECKTLGHLRVDINNLPFRPEFALNRMAVPMVRWTWPSEFGFGRRWDQ